MRIKLPNNWKPRDYQLPAWAYLEKGGRHAELIWHRRSGKDEIALHRTAVAAFERVAGYWHMLPEAAQARKAIWDAINPHTGKRRIDEAFPLELRETTREQEMMIRFKNGSTWQVVGSDNFNSLIGSPPAGVVFSEWALADPSARAYLRPILTENNGWSLYITTPRGNNHAKRTFDAAKKEPNAFAQLLTALDTKVFTPEQLEQERHQYVADFGKDEGEALFAQEYMCSFSGAVVGAYFASELAELERGKRLTRVPYDKAALVDTAWDLGIDDSTAIWFIQRVGREIHIIDYYESSGVGLDHYVKMLKEKPYIYGEHLLPHDSEAHELGTGVSRIETLRNLGLKATVVKRLSVGDGIHATRLLLAKAWIDSEKCERGYDALKQYRREWDEKLKTFKNRPVHDWTSHAADALRYFAVGINQFSDQDFFKPLKYDNRGIV